MQKLPEKKMIYDVMLKQLYATIIFPNRVKKALK